MTKIYRYIKWPGLLLTVLIVASLFGCGEEETRLILEPIERAPGGSIAAMTSLEVDDSKVVVAPAGNELFVRDVSASEWTPVAADWPARIAEQGLGLFAVVENAGREARLSPKRYFTEFENQLWTIALPAAGQRPRLLQSRDIGENWEEVPLPEEYEEAVPHGLERSAIMPSLRMMTTDSDFYLVDGQKVWRMDDSGDSVDADDESSIWESISIVGTPMEPADGDEAEDEPVEAKSGALPLRLRHYLPADEIHPFEVVTVHGRKLDIYRRGIEEERFEKVATLEAIDRDIIRDPTAEFWFLADSHTLYRSSDQGENWEELDIPTHSLAPEDFSQIEIFEDDRAEVDYQIWIMGDGGSLWRSSDGGDEWEAVMERDPDGRGITGLVRDERNGRWWTSTAGRGVLHSENPGDWEEANTGLIAGTTFNAVIAGEDRIFIGTDAGLYERPATNESVDWQRIDDRATSAIFLGADDVTISGTVGGSIVVRDGEDGSQSSEAAPLGSTEEILFAPSHLKSLRMERSAIVTLKERPDSRDIIAWSHRQGPLISNDGGSSWRRMQLGEAFHNALESGVITDFIATRDQTYFAVTRSRHPGEPTQLWRSSDGGTTWQATYSVMESEGETPMQLVRLPDNAGLLMAHGSRLATSTDMGATWTTIAGPWESGMLTGIAVAGDQIVVIMHLAHTSEIAWLDNPLQGASVAKRYRLIWPQNHGLDADRPVGIEVKHDRLLVSEGSRIYSGEMPRRRTSGQGGISIVAAMGVVIVLIALAFGYLRVWER